MRPRAPTADVPEAAPRSAHGLALALASGVALASFGLGFARLAASHPHEDAFILFRYAENLASGAGIVFHPDGLPTEGATDFLWLLALAGTRALGLDVAVAAQLWNALGAGLAAFLLARPALDRRQPVLALGAVGVLTTSASLAGWAGFGSMLYAALALWLADLALRDGPRLTRALPFVALALALVRPDGVLPGAAFVLGALVLAPPLRRARGAYAAGLAALVLGAGYFAWRAWYFGELLPLPLLVKSNGRVPFTLAALWADPHGVLPGLAALREWGTSRAGPLPFLLALAGGLACSRARRAHGRALALLALAAGVFLLQLAFARPMQNHAFRFQAPVALLTAYGAWRVLVALVAEGQRGPLVRGAATLLAFAMWLPGLTRVRDQWHWDERARSYMDVLPYRARAVLGRSVRVVLTEAGRLPFWTEARAHDAVGLNESRTAHRPPDADWLAEVDPDVVFFHVAGTLELAPEESGAVAVLAGPALSTALRPRWRAFETEALTAVPPGVWPEELAALVLARFLARHADEYELVAVRYQGGWQHVWGIRRSFAGRAALLAELRATSVPEAWQSYRGVAAERVR